MQEGLLKFTGLCGIVMAIILFCVVVGGYSSISRSQSRIKASKGFLTDACQKRQDLLPKLIKITNKTSQKDAIQKIEKSAQKADSILKEVISHDPPVEAHLIKEFEISQETVAKQLSALFNALEPKLNALDLKEFSALKNEFNSAQDYLFVTKKRYNSEVKYFNNRTKIFPGFLIAKMFGFNQLEYTGIAKDKFLSGEKTFLPSRS
jgi:LemA protein